MPDEARSCPNCGCALENQETECPQCGHSLIRTPGIPLGGATCVGISTIGCALLSLAGALAFIMLLDASCGKGLRQMDTRSAPQIRPVQISTAR